MIDVDVDRPTIHLTATRGWINDPLSLTWRDGEYHVFFQFVPDSVTWAPTCHWGHAVSKDLLTWSERPVALTPGDGDGGIWSGSVVEPPGEEATLFYTSVSEPDIGMGRIRVARPVDDSWDEWHKGEIVVEAPTGEDVTVFRDPFVFRDGDLWRMLVGARLRDSVAAALSYSSPDLTSWTYDGIAAQRPSALTEPVWTGSLWECPQIIFIDGSAVLITSVWQDDVLHYVSYAVGTWENGRFEARHWGRLTYGDSYYAPSFFTDSDGRPGLVFWLRDVRDAAGTIWSGAMSVPHTLTLDGDQLVIRPHTDVTGNDAVHTQTVETTDVQLASTKPTLLVWPEGVSELRLRDGDDQVVTANRTASDVTITVPRNGWNAVVPSTSEDIRILVDRTVVEISTGIGVFASPLSLTGQPARP